MNSNDVRRIAVTVGLPAWGIACLAYLLYVALTMRAGFPLHGDETFFASCAARGLATDRWLMPGCHDNKGPVIYLVYRAVAALAGDPYPAAALKLAAGGVLLGVLAVLGAMVGRAFGAAVAALGAFICLLTVASNPQTLVLNADLVGILLVAISAAVLDARRGSLAWRSLVAGLLVGLAMMTKQTFVLFAPMACWVVWREARSLSGAKAQGLVPVFLVCAGVALPLAALAAWFAASGELNAFLSSVFLYPLTYGRGVGGSAAREAAYRLLGVAALVDRTPLLTLGCVAALALALTGRGAPPRVEADRPHAGRVRVRRLLSAYVVAALLMMATAPVIGARVAFAFIIFGSFLAAVAYGELWASWRAGGRWLERRVAMSAFAVLAVVATLNVWGENRPVRDGDQGFGGDRVPEASGHFGYVFAIWPHFHYFNRMLPSSDAMYATAFDGRVAGLMMKAGGRAPWIEAWLTRTRREAEARLVADFAKTPPAFIVIGNTVETPADVPPRSGVAALDRYLDERCGFVRHLKPPTLETSRYTAMGLYVCR